MISSMAEVAEQRSIKMALSKNISEGIIVWLVHSAITFELYILVYRGGTKSLYWKEVSNYI